MPRRSFLLTIRGPNSTEPRVSDRVSVVTVTGEAVVRGRGVSIEVTSGWINIYRPRYFGNRPIRARAKDAAATNPFSRADNEEKEQDSDPELAAATRVTYINRPFTFNKDRILPNLVILFGEGAALPKVRPWTWTTPQGLLLHRPYKAMGREVDGVFVRVRDPVAAIEVLVAAGVTKTNRPGAWLRDHRSGPAS